MQNFVVNIRQHFKPIEIKANNENEARKIIEERLGKRKNLSSIVHVEFKIRNKNQSWLKSFIDNNF
jgi:hypothetical protein